MTEPAAPAPSRTGWIVTCALVALALALIVGWLAYAAGQRSAGHDAAAAESRRGVLEDQLGRVEHENEQLHAKVAELEMARRLDRDAYGQIERTLGDLQSQLARQTDDLAFYRSIVAPTDGIQGLRIQRLEVLAGTEPRSFDLKLTLVQAVRHESIVSGLAQVTVNGMQGDTPRKYTVGELLGRPHAQLPFSFRYFQTIEQRVVLPEGFEPFETEVRLQSSKVTGPIEQSFPWKPGRQAAL